MLAELLWKVRATGHWASQAPSKETKSQDLLPTGAPTCEPSTEMGDAAPFPSGQHGTQAWVCHPVMSSGVSGTTV